MTSRADVLDAVVVGAGWAGLGVSHALAGKGIRHRVFERGRIGETWRTQRWDSFRMNTPNLLTVMPGDKYDGPDPEGVMTRDAFVALLGDFAGRHALPVEAGTSVTNLTEEREDGVFRVTTSRDSVLARVAIVAAGSLNVPKRPASAVALPSGLNQLDASDYRSAAALSEGAVLVVGSAQSGGQIAEDLAVAGRTVLLATSRVGRLPRTYRGRDIAIWLVESGLFDMPRKDATARPTLGAQHTISLQSLSVQGVVLLGRFAGVEGGRLRFEDDLKESIRFADEAATEVRRQIDAYIQRAGIDAPLAEPDPAETVAARLPRPPILALDPTGRGLKTVIWCTGFQGDFRWIRLPGALDSSGQPVHRDGVARLPGLYFAGLDFAFTRRSGTILAIAEEAARLADHIVGSGRVRT